MNLADVRAAYLRAGEMTDHDLAQTLALQPPGSPYDGAEWLMVSHLVRGPQENVQQAAQRLAAWTWGYMGQHPDWPTLTQLSNLQPTPPTPRPR